MQVQDDDGESSRARSDDFQSELASAATFAPNICALHLHILTIQAVYHDVYKFPYPVLSNRRDVPLLDYRSCSNVVVAADVAADWSRSLAPKSRFPITVVLQDEHRHSCRFSCGVESHLLVTIA
jgi:hypothetical protein